MCLDPECCERYSCCGNCKAVLKAVTILHFHPSLLLHLQLLSPIQGWGRDSYISCYWTQLPPLDVSQSGFCSLYSLPLHGSCVQLTVVSEQQPRRMGREINGLALLLVRRAELSACCAFTSGLNITVDVIRILAPERSLQPLMHTGALPQSFPSRDCDFIHCHSCSNAHKWHF